MANGGTLVEVATEIKILRDAQKAHQADYQAAEELVVETLAAQDQARDAELLGRRRMSEARQIIDEYDDEIGRLLEEYQLLVPHQPGPVD